MIAEEKAAAAASAYVRRVLDGLPPQRRARVVAALAEIRGLVGRYGEEGAAAIAVAAALAAHCGGAPRDGRDGR